MIIAAAEPPAPAGGAATDQVLAGLLIVTVAYLPLGWFLWRERAGRPTVVGRVADWVSTKDGLPRWAGLPAYLAGGSLVMAGFGVYWDVPIHMQVGRDEGPLANPSHFPILFGILGFLAAGVLSAGLAGDPLPRRTVRVAPSWRVPMGAVVLLAAGLIAAAGFPADDVWHRLFGQDVTEWGPTHVMMIGGAVTASLAFPLLLAESCQVGCPPLHGRALLGRARATRLGLTLAVSLCIIPMAFLMEFDLGVPQFPAATMFIIAGFLTAWVFTAARLTFGPGGALLAWAVYLGLRVAIWLITLPVPDIHRARWLLFLGAAAAIELVALLVRSRGVLFGAAAGVAAGSAGMAAEWAWSGVFLPPPLPVAADQLPLMLGVGTVAGLGGGLLAVSWHRHLERVAVPGPVGDTAPGTRWTGTVGVGLLVALMAGFAPPAAAGEVDVEKRCDETGCRTSYSPVAGSGAITAQVAYDDACAGTADCRTRVTITLRPADAADDAVWLSAIAYQGKHEDDPVVPGDGMTTTAMAATDVPGEYRSVDVLPLYGSWKVMVRLHLPPTTMVALPLHLPEDPAIDGDGAGLVRADDGATVPFVQESLLLQRERRDGVPTWLWSVAYAVVVAAWLGLLACYGWCYAAAARGASTSERPGTRRRVGGPPGTRQPSAGGSAG